MPGFLSKPPGELLKALAALPVFFALAACNHWGGLSPEAQKGSGKWVSVKIGAINIAGGAKNETVTRAGGGSSRMVGEPIVQDLGGGMFAEIAVEEDLSALRAGDTSLGDKVKFRVIAVNSSDDKVYSYADYEVNKNKNTMDLLSEADLHVLDGGSYYFVCISYNNASLPDPPALNATLGNVSVNAGSNDLLYQITGTKSISGSLNLDFKELTHQLVRVQLKLDAGTNKTITNVPGPISLDASSAGKFNLKNGTFSSLSGNITFSGWTGLSAQTATSGMFTFLPKAAGTYAFSFAEGAVRRSGETGTSSAWTSYFVYSKFAATKSYTIAVKLYKKTLNKFAGSNIFWDGSKLTFYPHGENDYTKYQGVYFKWGSLIGVSPAQTSGSDDFSSGTAADQTSGTPIYLKVNGVWVKTNVAYATTQGWFGGSGWSDIPYQNDDKINTTNTDAHSLLDNPDFAAYKGDICNYINGSYRMPTRDELAALGIGDSGNGVYTGFNSANITNQTADGKTALVQFGTFTGISGTTYYLPASGYRLVNFGTLSSVGSYGYYWSGSANDSSYAYSLYFSSSDANTSFNYRANGFSVRCVLIE